MRILDITNQQIHDRRDIIKDFLQSSLLLNCKSMLDLDGLLDSYMHDYTKNLIETSGIRFYCNKEMYTYVIVGRKRLTNLVCEEGEFYPVLESDYDNEELAGLRYIEVKEFISDVLLELVEMEIENMPNELTAAFSKHFNSLI